MATNAPFEASGPFGTRYLGRLTFAQLPPADAALAGVEAWCTDYPSAEYGAPVYCTGTRWRHRSGEQALTTANYPDGLTIAAGATVLAAPVVTVPAGLILPGDSLDLRVYATGVADAAGATRDFDVRISNAGGSDATGTVAFRFRVTSTSAVIHDVIRSAIVSSATQIRCGALSNPGAATGTGSMQVSTVPSLSDASYLKGAVVNGSDTETITLYRMSVTLQHRAA